MAHSSGEWMWGASSEWSDTETEEERSRGSSRYSVDSCDYPGRGEAVSVPTTCGSVQVTVCGNRQKPGLITYHDVGLNHMTCFQGLMLCADTSSLLLHNFCIYHIDAPGHESPSDKSSPPGDSYPHLTVDDLAEQVADVVYHFGLNEVVCMGVGAGAYILTLFALSHPRLVESLILISPVCTSPSWSEWAFTKVMMSALSLYGMSKFVKDTLLQRYFCQEQRGFQGPGSDTVMAFRRELEERSPKAVLKFVDVMLQRRDLTPLLSQLQCDTLIVVGQHSQLHAESMHMFHNMDFNKAEWMEVQACGSLVTEERPHKMQGPLERFLCRHGYCRPPPMAYAEYRSPLSSPSSPSFSYEDLSLSALGIQLKPIKTKIEMRAREELVAW